MIMLGFRSGGLQMRQRKRFISIFILMVIGLHAVPVLQRLQDERQTLWPIMAWGMYRNARAPGPIQTTIRRVVGTTSKGEEETITPNLLGLSGYAFERMYIKPMRAGHSSAAHQLIARLNLSRDDPFVELRLQSETYRVTETGVVKEDNPVIAYRVDP
jgi:hypothetical protein